MKTALFSGEWIPGDSIEDAYPDITETDDNLFRQAKRVITSTVILIPAYVIAFLIQQYITGGLCIIFEYEPDISYNHIGNLPFHYRYWSLPRILVIFSAGPVICFIIGVIFLDLFTQLSHQDTLYRFFFLWLGVCCINVFLGFFLFTPIGVEQYFSGLYTGFSIVATWLRLSGGMMWPFAILAALGSMITGYLICGNFLKFSFSSRLLQSPKGRRKIIIQFFVIPVLVAAPILFFLATPKTLFLHVYLTLNFLLMAIGIFLRIELDSSEVIVFKKDILNTIPVFSIIFALGVYLSVFFFLK